MRLATWEKSTPSEFFGFSHYGHSGSSSHLWLNFRHEDIYTSHADTIRNFGVYIWFSDDKTISMATKMHDVHSADLTELTNMVKFLKKNNINTPFIKVEGRQHLQLLLKEVLTTLKVENQTNYPSDKITKIDLEHITSQALAYMRSQFACWNF